MLKAKLEAIANMKDMFNFENQSTKAKSKEKQHAKQTILSYLKELNRDSNSLTTPSVGQK